jgi:hypothetical protein
MFNLSLKKPIIIEYKKTDIEKEDTVEQFDTEDPVKAVKIASGVLIGYIVFYIVLMVLSSIGIFKITPSTTSGAWLAAHLVISIIGLILLFIFPLNILLSYPLLAMVPHLIIIVFGVFGKSKLTALKK